MKKNKKILTLFGLASISFAFFMSASPRAEELNPGEQNTTEEITYSSKVVEKISDGGDVLFDIKEGNVGDLVTAYVKPNLFFSVTSVVINGELYEIDKNGKYQFQLIEGENVFSVNFEIDNKKIEEIATLVNGVKKDGFESLFTINNLLNLISWVVTVFLSSGFFITLIRNKKLKSKTTEQIVGLITETINNENAKALEKFLSTLMPEVLDKINLKIDNVDECMKVLCRCFVLAQSDTPEDRLAIITELTKLNNSDETLSAQIRNIVKEEQAAQAQVIAERDEAIKKLKDNNRSLITEEKVGDTYGQI